jgi:hypothetical protein
VGKVTIAEGMTDNYVSIIVARDYGQEVYSGKICILVE